MWYLINMWHELSREEDSMAQFSMTRPSVDGKSYKPLYCTRKKIFHSTQQDLSDIAVSLLYLHIDFCPQSNKVK